MNLTQFRFESDSNRIRIKIENQSPIRLRLSLLIDTQGPCHNDFSYGRLLLSFLQPIVGCWGILSLSLFCSRVGYGFLSLFSSTDVQELDIFFISFSSTISPRVGQEEKKRDWISYSFSSDLLFLLRREKEKKSN